jgi:LysR family transcriptional regulator, carnitine catabolism transcriptional activator
MTNISIKHLRTFLAVVEAGNFRRASETLHLSQPGVTTHVKQLERAVGMPLLDRTTRRMRVTPAGDRLRIVAERTLADLNGVLFELRDEASLRRGRISVSCVPTIAANVLPKALRRFTENHPAVTVVVYDVISAELFAQVAANKVDFGIGPRPNGQREFDFRSLICDPFVAVVPLEHPWTSKKRVSLYDLTKVPFLALPRGYNVREMLDASLAAQGLNILPRYEVWHHYTLGGMIEAGLGVTALPSMAISMLSQPLLKTVPISQPSVAREVGVIKTRGKSLSPASEAFIKLFSSILNESG